ncbi:unnamed protein product, partial [Prorocentrum cordatum]
VISIPRQIGAIFDNDPEILDLFEEVRWPLAAFIVTMNIGTMMEQVPVAVGRTSTVFWAGLAGSWLGQVPCVLLCVNFWRRDLVGLYTGVAAGYLLLGVLLGSAICTINWHDAARQARERSEVCPRLAQQKRCAHGWRSPAGCRGDGARRARGAHLGPPGRPGVPAPDDGAAARRCRRCWSRRVGRAPAAERRVPARTLTGGPRARLSQRSRPRLPAGDAPLAGGAPQRAGGAGVGRGVPGAPGDSGDGVRHAVHRRLLLWPDRPRPRRVVQGGAA